MRRVVVVGGSAAGYRAADGLGQRDAFDEILVVSRDPSAPHYRPALSKQLLSGEWDLDRAGLSRRDHDRVIWLSGVSAVGLDTGSRQLQLDDGSAVEADAVVLAGGCRPRTLAGLTPSAHVHVLHTQADAFAIGAELQPDRRLLVVGAGLIGSEVAAIAAKRGAPTTLIDPAAAPLIRALGPLGDQACMARHVARGCELRLGVGVNSIEDGPDAVTVTLSTGEVQSADAVVVCVGVVPDTAWLASSGVPIAADGGVVCDPTLTVGPHPWVMAGGDVASWWSAAVAARLRVEHWFTALEHGAHVAANLALPAPERAHFPGLPFFWTEQHEVMIHVIGTHAAESEWSVVEGDLDGAFVALATTGGRTTAALLIDSAQRLGAYRKIVRDAALPIGTASAGTA